MATYIKLYRGVVDHPMLSDDNTAYIVFTKLLARVDWKTGKLITGRKKFGLMVNLKPTTAWAALQRLENDSMIVMSSDKYKTQITVVNWSKFQGSDKADVRSTDQVSSKSRPFNGTNNKNKRKEEYIYKSSFNQKGVRPPQELKQLEDVRGQPSTHKEKIRELLSKGKLKELANGKST